MEAPTNSLHPLHTGHVYAQNSRTYRGDGNGDASGATFITTDGSWTVTVSIGKHPPTSHWSGRRYIVRDDMGAYCATNSVTSAEEALRKRWEQLGAVVYGTRQVWRLALMRAIPHRPKPLPL